LEKLVVLLLQPGCMSR